MKLPREFITIQKAKEIDRLAEKNVKVTIRNIAASLIHEYAKSIAVKNTTSPALIFSRIGATQN